MKPTEINIFLLKKGISQTALAKGIGVRPCTISSLFAGRINISDAQLDRIAQWMGITRRKLDAMIHRAKDAA